MRKLLAPALVVLAAAHLSGCVILESDTDVQADGSGTLEVSVSLADDIKRSLADLKTMEAGRSPLDFPDLDSITREAIAAAGADHGVEVEKFERSAADGRQMLDLMLSFADLEGLSYVMSRILSDGNDQGGLGIYAAADGNFVLKPATYDFPPAPAKERPKPETQAAPDQARQMELMGRMMDALAELDVTMRITVPGEIVTSSAPATEGRTSIWKMNAANMMSGDAEMNPEIVFVGEDLKIKPLKEE